MMRRLCSAAVLAGACLLLCSAMHTPVTAAPLDASFDFDFPMTVLNFTAFNGLACTNSSAVSKVITLVSGSCAPTSSPQLGHTYPSMLIDLNPETNEYRVSFFRTSNCLGGDAPEVVFGRGDECSTHIFGPDGAIFSIRIQSDLTAECQLAQYADSACTQLTSIYGITPSANATDCLTPSFDSDSFSREFIVSGGEGDMAKYVDSHFQDAHCTQPIDQVAGTAGECNDANQIISCFF